MRFKNIIISTTLLLCLEACENSTNTLDNKSPNSSDHKLDSLPAIEMINVEGGTFLMGTDFGDQTARPRHSVTLGSFRIGKYEVTQAQWELVMGRNPSLYKPCPQCPVESVNWNEAQEFIRKLNARTGKNYRLPTEAEWEFAAEGGLKSKGFTFSGSNDINSVAWYNQNSGDKTQEVGTKKPNELGIYDMTGNVWEWCSDWYGSYTSSSEINPKGSTSGESRVLRGGSWFFGTEACYTYSRGNKRPDHGDQSVGFRLVLDNQ